MFATRLRNIACGLCLVPAVASAELRIVHIDVEMGDATLIMDTDTRESLLIDAGNRGKGRKNVLPLLQELGLSSVDYFIATHYDADHIGGFDELIDAGIRVNKTIFDRGDYTDRSTLTQSGNPTQYGQYLNAADPAKRTVPQLNCTPQNSSDFLLGGGIRVSFVAVAGQYYGKDADGNCTVKHLPVPKGQDNALSIAVLVEYGEFSYLSGGDLTGGGRGKKDMETLVAQYTGDIDVLRVNHHGSDTSSNQASLDMLKPEVAIISVGKNGRYKLPRQTVLDRLDNAPSNPAIYLTNPGSGGSLADAVVVNDHIVLDSNGTDYSVDFDWYRVDEG